ncbi:hypothetical protein HYH03_013414 [Edaphochlamys debaryana]|uniref:NADP-dependent oxidoreductase domain-containing protein n=1 Tax=Edaphochlamys debaryana TaxID=47281 RepID=A0A836BUJ0_9CHLO|nr:hypothetical protein HYH03_013414 [Edaphochlamys debaryana]|eukprot:KAG2487974.1 hypothetical protein HYH03_013414 [Edaphochlamys debaryana]
MRVSERAGTRGHTAAAAGWRATRLGSGRRPAVVVTAAAASSPARASAVKLPDIDLQRVPLGSSDLVVSEVCLGTMTWGEQNTEAEAHAQLSLAAEAGINFMDTAEIYPVAPRPETANRTSAYIGSWMRRGGRREDWVIASKVAGRSTTLEWVPANRSDPPGPPSLPRLDSGSIVAACEAELRRLGTDRLDLLQLHWPDRYVPGFGRFQFSLEAAAAHEEAAEAAGAPVASFEEQAGAIERLMREGKIRAWGLSNETSYGVMRHCAAAAAAGIPRPASIQNSYSMLHRTFEGDLAEVCANMDMGLLPWSPLAGGALSGKYLPHGSRPPGCRLSLFPDRYARFLTERVSRAVSEYVLIAREAGLTPSQLAYAWCRSRWFVPSVLVGATSTAQLAENLGAWAEGGRLAPETVEAIEQVHARHRNPALYD